MNFAIFEIASISGSEFEVEVKTPDHKLVKTFSINLNSDYSYTVQDQDTEDSFVLCYDLNQSDTGCWQAEYATFLVDGQKLRPSMVYGTNYLTWNADRFFDDLITELELFLDGNDEP